MPDDPADIVADVAREDGVDPELAELERRAAALHARGIDFHIADGQVVLERHPTQRDRTVQLDLGAWQHIRLGVLSDTHGGSNHEQLTALRTFYAYADGQVSHPDTGEPIGQAVDAFIHCGDWVQGADKMHLDQPYQVHAHGADQQTKYVIATYPRSVRPTVRTYGIGGNHDDSFLKDGGTNVVRTIAAARDDIEYIGQTGAYLSIGPINLYVTHPSGGTPYAKSYRLQKFVEALPISRKIHLLLMGHLHSYALVQEHGVTAFLVPCFQSQYGWLAGKGLHPVIGGLIVDVWLTDAGEVARIRHELIRFQPVADDWDQDASRQVNRGWTPDGLLA